MSESKLSRRNFLRLSALGAAGTVLLPALIGR
ncbi:MAG: twin-arginine translocation signal domain-containing protein [Alistipes indistinctus]